MTETLTPPASGWRPKSPHGYAVPLLSTRQVTTRGRSGAVPCGSCGSDAQVVERVSGGKSQWVVRCTKCRSAATSGKKRKAIKLWNTTLGRPQGVTP